MIHAFFCFLDINRRLNWSSFLFVLPVMFLVISEKIQNWTRERETERDGGGGEERKRERESEREREREIDRERERERERERKSKVRRVGGRGSREEGGKWWKRVQELTYWLQCCSNQMHDFPKSEGKHVSLESLQSFKGLGMPHYVILPNETLHVRQDIRPDASRLRTVHSSCADGDCSEISPPQTLQQRRLTPVAWLMTFHCFSKSTVLFDSPVRKKTCK